MRCVRKGMLEDVERVVTLAQDELERDAVRPIDHANTRDVVVGVPEERHVDAVRRATVELSGCFVMRDFHTSRLAHGGSRRNGVCTSIAWRESPVYTFAWSNSNVTQIHSKRERITEVARRSAPDRSFEFLLV